MNSLQTHLRIKSNLSAAISKFVDDEHNVSQLMRPKLAGVDRSRWMQIHYCLFDILVSGNDLAFCMGLQDEIGQIEASAIRPTCLKIDQYIHNLGTMKSYFSPWVTTDPVFQVLDELEDSCLLLVEQLNDL